MSHYVSVFSSKKQAIFDWVFDTITPMETAINQTPEPSISGGFSIEELLMELSEKEDIIEQKSLVISEQKKRIALLEEYLRLEKSRRYGASSEKNPNQGELFNEAEQLADQAQAKPDRKPVKKTRKGRKGLSKKIPRVQIYLDLSEEEKAGAIDTFYSKVKEELDIVPAKVQVLEYLQEKAVFKTDDGEKIVKAAKRPRHPLGKVIASINLLAYLIVAKYCDALPLYRMEKILSRYGGDITRTSMANWIIRIADILMPLINLIKDHQLSAPYLQMDETRMQVLKEPGKPASSDKWFWEIRGGPPDQPAILFEYDASRSADVPSRLLAGFKGALQTDGYSGYNRACRENGLVRIGCWDHARRKFKDAVKAMPAKQKRLGKTSKAEEALSTIQKLYAIEKKIKDLGVEERFQYRQEQSLPILEAFKPWLETNIPKVPKGSLTYEAMAYALNQWESLIGYCNDGRYHISNILAENAIRPIALGRRNWLFSDTPKGARASAVCFSLIETAKANGLEPYAYIRHVLRHIATADTVEKLEALLPWNVKGQI